MIYIRGSFVKRLMLIGAGALSFFGTASAQINCADPQNLEEYGVCRERALGGEIKGQGLFIGDVRLNADGESADAIEEPDTSLSLVEDVVDGAVLRADEEIVETSKSAVVLGVEDTKLDRVEVPEPVRVEASGVAYSNPTPERVVTTPENRVEVAPAEGYRASVFFSLGSDRLLPASDADLSQSAAAMLKNTHWALQINGHASADGDDDYNMYLSSQRAKAVYNALKLKGVPAERMSYKGFGETQLKDAYNPNSATNRRVEMVLSFQ